jgi:tRNA (pseudouridine54-N1)-methyltransferase
MREFLLYSRMGKTDQHWTSMHDAGRLDVVHECIVASFFFSHGLRRDTNFNAVLNGPPSPPVRLHIEGSTLYDVRTDYETWQTILRKVLGGKQHPGITTEKAGFEAFLKGKAESSTVYVLEEGGRNVEDIEFPQNPLFILGDHVGLPKNAERFALRFGEKVSLGKQPYLAASCITVLNYLLDRQQKTAVSSEF